MNREGRLRGNKPLQWSVVLMSFSVAHVVSDGRVLAANVQAPPAPVPTAPAFEPPNLQPSLLDFVTRIVVMEEGRVLASGSHEDLLRTCSVYDRLYHAASRKMGTDGRDEAAVSHLRAA